MTDLSSPDGGLLSGALSLIEAGGPVVVILAGMSTAAFAIVFAKLWQFYRHGLLGGDPGAEVLGCYRAGRLGEAVDLARRSRHPVALLLALAIEGRRRTDVPEALLREELQRVGGDMLAALRCYLRPLEVIASLAPLLGLFGTVLGMIAAFQDLQQAGSRVDPSILSGGIWEALLTTAVGLAVAIPTVAAASWFEGTVERTAQAMDSAATSIFTADLQNVAVRPERREADHGRATPVRS